MTLQDGENELVRAGTVRPKEYRISTTKLESLAFSEKENLGLYTDIGKVMVGRKKAQEVNTYMCLDFKEFRDRGIQIAEEDRLTRFDRLIHDAVSTLWEVGHDDGRKDNEYITPRILYQVINGNSGNSEDCGKKMRDRILSSLDKMRNTQIEIDASEEAHAFKICSYRYRGNLLPSERVEAVIRGQRVDCIHVFRLPPLFEYAERKRQIDHVKLDILRVPGVNTIERIEVKDYLLRRVLSAKNKTSKLQGRIKMSTLYDEIGVQESTDKKRKKVRDTAKRILDYWGEKGFIKGYRIDRDGMTFAALDIEV